MRKIIVLLLLVVLLSSCATKKLKTEERLGEEVYIYEGMQIPTILGEPQLKPSSLAEKKKNTAADVKDEITTYADAMVFLKNKTFGTNGKNVVTNLCTLIENDYEEIEPVVVVVGDQLQYVVSIKTNDKHYLLDPLSDYLGNQQWLQNYKLEKGSFDTKEELIAMLSNAYPQSGVTNVFCAPHDPERNELDFNYIDGEFNYNYKNWDYSFGYGFPVLTEKEIDELLIEAEKGNYDEIRNRITTVPDMIYFLKRYGFKQTGMNNITKTDTYSGADVGNIMYYDDRFCYTISGRELLMVNEGQCSATATLLCYMLTGDYEEVGYVPIVFVSKDDGVLDGHVINYIKNNDKYYLVSPSYYLTGDGAWKNQAVLRKGYDTIEEAMNQLLASSYPNGQVISTAAFIYDGIYVCWDDRRSDKVAYRLFPEGSVVKVCFGSDYGFGMPKHPTDQDYILGVTIKK